jgi:photosystem II stability/assembly factor-like uncharacterized protein
MITRRALGQGVAASAVALALPGLARADAAATKWRKLATEPYRGKQDDIAFIDPQTGWYGNGAGKLYRTVDGGEIWTKVSDKPGTFIRALGLIDAKTGFIGNVGTDYYPGVTDNQPLYRTDDGGVTWVAVNAPGIEKVAGICGIDILPVTRVFQGEPRRTHIIHAAGRVGGPAMMLKSMDGGDSWTVEDLSAQAGMILDVKFLDAMTGFVCAASKSDLGEGEALILRTGDGGKSWTPVYQSGRKLENCWKMSWPSKRVGYATVQSYDEAPGNTRRVIVKTTDGGRSWRELPLVTAAGVQEFGIGFVDEKRGWVGCKASGFETRDGGKSWTAVEFGRAVNKVRIVRNDSGVARAFAIGVDVHRLDLTA